MAKFVYVVKQGCLNTYSNRYEFYSKGEVYSSLKKAKKYVDWILDVNKAKDIVSEKWDKAIAGDMDIYQTDYNFLVDVSAHPRMQSARILIEKYELK